MARMGIRLVLLVLVLVSSFVASGAFHVAKDEVAVVGYRQTETYVAPFGYVAEPGWYVGDPFAEVYKKVRLGFEQPTTTDYIEAAYECDKWRDAWLKAEGTQNPKTEKEITQLSYVVIEYINRRPEIARPVRLDAIEYFKPNKMSGRYDEELAHFDYIARTMRFNMEALRSVLRAEDSVLAIITHELSHSALNVLTGETLCQLLTLQVLHDMMDAGVPGAGFAFWDELRWWFISAARFRVEFNHGWRAISLGDAWEVEGQISYWRAKEMPRTWAAHACPDCVYLFDTVRMLWNSLCGRPYEAAQKPLAQTPTGAVGIKLIETAYNLRARGLTIYPGKWLYEAGVPISFLRATLGPTYAHRGFTLLRGEREMVEEWVGKMRQGERQYRAEYQEKMQSDPGYFAESWWMYLYAPLQMLESSVYMQNPVAYWVLTKDINEISAQEWMYVYWLGLYVEGRMMAFEDVGPLLHKLLNLRPVPIVEKDTDGLWQVYPIYVYETESPPAKPFPLAPIVFAALLVLEAALGRGIAKARAWMGGLYGAFGHVPRL